MRLHSEPMSNTVRAVRLGSFMLSFFISTTALVAQTQTPDLADGVKPHAKLDAIYERFSEAYHQLDASMVADLYTEDAYYLAPSRDVLRGREAIEAQFKDFFGQVSERGQRMRISFEIVHRELSGDEGHERGYDVGIYTLQFESKDGEGSRAKNRGKFITITECDGERCRFAVDGYSALPPLEEAASFPES